MRILLIEDDLTLCESLRRDLVRAGFAVDVANDGINGEFMGMTEPYDLCVLDLGLPGMSGLEILRKWRSNNNAVPVLILTARDAWHERLDGFKAGADDYLGKPFHVEELIARLSALAKRSHGHAPTHMVGQGWHLDDSDHCVVWNDGRRETLTSSEYRLLRCLMLNPGKVLSKTYLMEHAYDSSHDFDSNVIEVYINRLRRKLQDETISTRRGQGYTFSLPKEDIN